MDRMILNSFFNLNNLYNHYPALNYFTVDDYQLLTIVWNIFLILVPLWLCLILKSYWRRTGLKKASHKALAAIIFIFWLLFFPNTAYIITAIRHLLDYCPLDSPDKVCAANAWMIIFFFTYAAAGWVAFYYLLKLMSNLLSEIFNKFRPALFAALVIPLTSLGVLLGLLNRFNSWDIFLFPALFRQAFLVYFFNLVYFIDWFIFTIFLYLLYFIGDVIFRQVKHE